VKIPKRKLPINANPLEEQEERTAKEKQKGTNMGAKTTVKFNKHGC
jgi:hypothetical protein